MSKVYNWFVKGKRLLEKGDYTRSIFYFEQAKLEMPQKGSIREALARAYYNSGQLEKAKNEFEAALEIDPTNSFAYFGLGLCLIKMGKPVLALAPLKLCCALSPDEGRYQRSLARAKSMLKSEKKI